MAGELRWHEPDKILLTTYAGNVTPEELSSTIEDIIIALDSASTRIHVIVDWRQTTDYPFFVDLLFPARKLVRNPHLGWIVIVGQNNTIKLWIDLFSSISDFRYKTFDTLPEASDFLRTVVM